MAYSSQITAVIVPYITKCVHLSIKSTSSKGVFGIGIKHTAQITKIMAMLKG